MNTRIYSRGYLARDMDVQAALHLTRRLVATRDRMRKRQDCPQWYLEEMADLIHQADCLVRPLREHRDELAAQCPTPIGAL